jgi:hypothetical protein
LRSNRCAGSVIGDPRWSCPISITKSLTIFGLAPFSIGSFGFRSAIAANRISRTTLRSAGSFMLGSTRIDRTRCSFIRSRFAGSWRSEEFWFLITLGSLTSIAPLTKWVRRQVLTAICPPSAQQRSIWW